MGMITLVSAGMTNSEPGTAQLLVQSRAVKAKHPSLWPSHKTWRGEERRGKV